MAQIILGTNETFTVGANSTATVVGGSGTEKVIVAAGSVVTTDQSVERTELSGKSSDYTYSISGNVITVKSGATTVATLTGGNGDKTIAFADGSATLALTALNTATLGNQAISTTGSTLTPALNTADKSTAGTSGTTNGGSTSTTGQTFTLTTGTDNLVGTAGDDKFNGVLQDAGATGTTTQPGDYITGGEGNDTLNISVAGTLAADYTISAVQTDGVEKVVLSNFETSANNTIVAADLMNNLATVGLASSSATGDTVFTGLKNLVAAEMRNGAADLTVTYNSDVVSGTTDSQTLTVSNISGGTFTANGAETIAVTTALVKSTLTDVVSDSVTKLTVDGTADLTLTNATAVKTIDANTLTGKLNITAGNANQLVTGGTSGDTFDFNTNLTSSDTINGGAGNDTLKLSVGNATIDVGTSASKQELYNVSNIEIIDIASTNDGATLDLTGTTGVSTVVAAANVKTVTFTGNANAESNAATITFTLNGTSYTTAALDLSGIAAADVSAANTALKNKINLITGFTATAGTTGPVTITATTGEAVEIAVTDQTGATAAESAYSDVAFSNITTQSVDIYSGDAVTASLKDASGSADVLNVNLKTLSVDKGFAHSVGTITANNIESMNLSATGMSDAKITTVAALTGNAIKTLTITGDSDVTISSFTGSIALATIDASTSTGDINLAAAPAAIVQSIKTGTGNDTIDLGAYLTAADTIDGGANNATTAGTTGKDKLTASGNLGTSTVPVALNINNVETIEVSIGTTAATYINAATIIGASSLAFSNDTSGGTVKITNLPVTTVVGLGIGAVELGDTTTTTVDLALADATGSSDTITVNYSDSIDANNSVTLKIDAAIETL